MKELVEFSRKYGSDPELVLAGGVSANSVLRAKIIDTAQKNNWKLYLPDLSLCGDNAAMVAAQGYYEFKAGYTADMSLNGKASKNIDENYTKKT